MSAQPTESRPSRAPIIVGIVAAVGLACVVGIVIGIAALVLVGSQIQNAFVGIEGTATAQARVPTSGAVRSSATRAALAPATVGPASTPAGLIPTILSKRYSAAPPLSINPNKLYLVTMETSKGTISFTLFPSDAPIATNNFVFLSRDGFYNGLAFHRVEDWVVQGGDPQGNGTGGPGYTIPDEKVTKDYQIGVLAMAKTSAPNSGGSQFFILKQATALPKVYTIFGTVNAGLDVVLRLAIGDRIVKVTVQEN